MFLARRRCRCRYTQSFCFQCNYCYWNNTPNRERKKITELKKTIRSNKIEYTACTSACAKYREKDGTEYERERDREWAKKTKKAINRRIKNNNFGQAKKYITAVLAIRCDVTPLMTIQYFAHNDHLNSTNPLDTCSNQTIHR